MNTQRIRIAVSYAISVFLIHLSILAWNVAHLENLRGVIHDATSYISPTATHLLPMQSPPTPQEVPRFIERLNRPSPTWPLDREKISASHLANSHTARPFGDGYRSNTTNYHILYLALVTFVPIGPTIVLVVYVLLWDRYLRPPSPRPIVFWSLIVDANKTLLFLLPLPFIIGVFIKWYIHLFINIVFQNIGSTHHFAPFTVDMPTQIILAILMLGMYPLVFLHLRWRRAAKLAASGATTTHCQRCGYPVETLDLCPECGTPKATEPDPKLSRRRKRILIAGYLAFPLLLIAPFWLSWIDILL